MSSTILHDKAVHHHLATTVVEDGHVVLSSIDLLEGQHVANPEIMGNGNTHQA
jgi:hypothetical protein